MKRVLIIVLGLCLLQTGFCTAPPVAWQLSVSKQNDSTYSIIARGTIEKNWYIYSDNNRELNGIELKFDDENISGLSTPEITQTPALINDKIFKSKLRAYVREVTLQQDVTIRGAMPAKLSVTISGFAGDGQTFLPFEETRQVQIRGGTESYEKIKIQNIKIDSPQASCGEAMSSNKNIFSIFILGFLGGLVALITPCVFPMIPVTVSYFSHTKKTKTKSGNGINLYGLLYGAFILIIYLLASLPFHLLGNVDPEIFNTISTNVWLNIFFFIVFIFFSLSLFGLFELILPGNLATKTDSRSGLKTITGIFFMALTLVIVSFSCTGPILGSLLVGSLSSTGGAWQLTAGLGGFGLALALPFALFSLFPQWIQHIPKSGGWLDVTKRVLAFVELALAFKFLSNADLVAHWGILKREVFLFIWFVISLGLFLYIIGGGKPSAKVSPARAVFGFLTLLLSIYIIAGIAVPGTIKLSLLSGLAPPVSYSLRKGEDSKIAMKTTFVLNDYKKALQLAHEQNKPLLIDFTGWACVNCRKMEENVWSDNKVSSLLKDNFILTSLYVDDRKKLPADKRFSYRTSDGNIKDIETTGDLWATFESENFKQVSQPLYVVLSPNEKLMNYPVGYTPDAKTYSNWLECGLDAYKNSR